jgi:hypothetical protein
MEKAAVANPSGIAFAGSSDEQELAARVHEVMRRQPQVMMYADDRAITMTLDRIMAGLSRTTPNVKPAKVRAALDANPDVFARQESDGTVTYATTKSGRHPYSGDDGRHMLSQRLNPDATPVSTQESRNLTEGWVARAATRAENFTIFMEPAAEAAVGPARLPARPGAPPAPYTTPPQVLPPVRPPIATVPTAFAPPFSHAGEEPLVQEEEAPPALVDVPAAPAPVEAAVEAPPAPVEEEPVAPAPPVEIAVEAAVEAPVAPVPEAPPVVAAPVVPPAPPAPVRPIEYTLNTPNGPQTIDLSRPVDELMADYGAVLADMVTQALRDDFRLVSFAEDWFVEDQVERFSKGDFRRIKDYLIEEQEALTDHAFMTTILNRRENDPDYARLRFSLNYRMHKEKKDFEFVGVARDRLWIVAGASPVSAPKRKPSELGQDDRHLEDPAIQALEPGFGEPAPARLEHTLTYYEYENGLLPYDQVARALFPQPLLDDQRAVLLRFEVPTLFQAFPVELRFPTGNRGGYLVGLDLFFQENLVPGAKFTVEPTDQEDVFTLRFERTAAAQEARLLQFDERRSRFAFQPTTYYAEVDPNALLSDTRFPRLNNHKRMDEAERKKSEAVVTNAFELVGEHIDDTGRWWASMDDLLPVVNLERPFSVGALRAVLEAGHPYLYPDPENEGTYFYDPDQK